MSFASAASHLGLLGPDEKSKRQFLLLLIHIFASPTIASLGCCLLIYPVEYCRLGGVILGLRAVDWTEWSQLQNRARDL
jgi:hypothetical protein